MQFAHVARTLRSAGLVLGLAAVTFSAALAADVVEFYNASLDNYFITADPLEAAAVDRGAAGPGWSRTGDTFGAGGPIPVCRFYGSQSPGPNSHFYTALATECEALKLLQAATPITQKRWNFESLDFATAVPAGGSCAQGRIPVYRAYNDGFARGVDSNHRITRNPDAIAAVVARGWKSEGVVMCAPPLSFAEKEADVVRLLEQSTLGPTEALVSEVMAKGIAPWLDEQLAMNVTRFAPRPIVSDGPDPLACFDDRTEPITPEKFCATNLKSGVSVAWEFFRQARTAPDQLRLRLAYAWHLSFAVQYDGFAYGVAAFQQRLRDHAFGTFENLLLQYTLAPPLGHFQNWVNNLPEHDGIRPNENFARELMQLFTIGVNALNDDGTPKLDANGRLIPNYTQADIETLARILTGFTYPTQPGNTPRFPNPDYYLGDMIPFDNFHDQGAKNALGGRLILPAGGGAMAELRTLIRVLIEHPSTAPFISRLLIQRLVTSSPTPAYVARVAAIFKDNGRGVRGDLAALVRAILLDPEARGARKPEARYGRLREPVLLWTAMIRALDVVTDGLIPQGYARNSGQDLFWPPTVFGYFPADFTLFGSTTPAPEFGVFSTTEYITRSNQVNDLFVQPGSNDAWSPKPWIANATGTQAPKLAPFLTDAGSAEALVERLNRLLLHGAMSPAMRKTIVNAVNRLPAGESERRVRMALRLLLTSVDYQVQK